MDHEGGITPYLNLTKDDLRARLHASKVRQGLQKRPPTILADQMAHRLTGLCCSHPASSSLVADWQQRLKTARLQQNLETIETVKYEYLMWLETHDLEEFWYKESEAGTSIVMKHYESLSNALKE